MSVSKCTSREHYLSISLIFHYFSCRRENELLMAPVCVCVCGGEYTREMCVCVGGGGGGSIPERDVCVSAFINTCMSTLKLYIELAAPHFM